MAMDGDTLGQAIATLITNEDYASNSLGQKIADEIVDTNASPESKIEIENLWKDISAVILDHLKATAQIEALWKDIANEIVDHIKTNAVITANQPQPGTVETFTAGVGSNGSSLVAGGYPAEGTVNTGATSSSGYKGTIE